MTIFNEMQTFFGCPVFTGHLQLSPKVVPEFFAALGKGCDVQNVERVKISS